EGVPGGTVGGVEGGAASPPPGVTTMQFSTTDMVPPKLIAGRQPSYTVYAKEACVEGRVIARCTLTEDGVLVDCRIVKGLPFLDKEVLDALATHRYTPVLYKGKPQRVYYTFPFRFRIHDTPPPPAAAP